MNVLRTCSRLITRIQNANSICMNGKRYIKRSVRPIMLEISKRKKEDENIKPDPRYNYAEWNYDAEIYAFNERLKEKFSLKLLTQALSHSSYVFQEEQKQRAVGIENPQLDIEDNKELIKKGEDITSKIVEIYLGMALPRAPEECIFAIHDYLLSQQMLARSASLIGTTDIILTSEYPPSEKTYAKTFLALVAALVESTDEKHAAIFVRDFLIASLAEKDLTEIWHIDKPVQILNDILNRDGRESVEPRIIAQSGISTLVPVYKIGLYSNKEYISSGTENNINDATQIAALNALYKKFGVADSSNPMKYNLLIDPLTDSIQNLPLHKWCTKSVNRLLQQN